MADWPARPVLTYWTITFSVFPLWAMLLTLNLASITLTLALWLTAEPKGSVS